jgi:hypothetical protein
MWHKTKWISLNMEIRKRSLSGSKPRLVSRLSEALVGWMVRFGGAKSFAREPGQLIDISTINEFPE